MKKLFLLAIIASVANLTYADWAKTNAPTDKTALCFVAIGSNYFAGMQTAGVYKSTNSGGTWNPANTGIELFSVRSLVVNGSNLIAGTSEGVYVSSNNGDSWTERNTGLWNKEVYSLLLSGTKLFAGTENGIFLSENEGVSWTAVKTGLDTTKDYGSLISMGSNIFAASAIGVFKSDNNGGSWTKVNTGLTVTSVGSLAVSGSNLFAGTNNTVFLSTNQGANWTPVNIDQNINSLMVNGSKLFAGTNEGIFVSTNNGANWKANNQGFGIVFKHVGAMAVFGTDIFASAALLSSEIWKRPVSEMVTEIKTISGGIRNLEVYPNPNPGIFTLTSTGNIEQVSIQNLLGETVMAITELIPGTPMKIDLTEFGKGMYFIVFRSNGQESVKKVIVN